ncbi:hypothetical protein [Leisingera sp. JC1]|uniref:hypothetical protein n=1 Tax=Leisingera sp. JC1 TaxID=1855282 RepID=UPI000802D8E8|nr:hypothetical protein [Leisingera sp. JC1]OBY25100.1 hypothetical protein A9D60_07715 [Leisingera sp. JC1]
MNVFNAGTQYNDYLGTVAADRSDNLALLDHLKQLGVAGEDDRLAGFRIAFNGNPGNAVDSPGLVVYLYTGPEGEFVAAPDKIRAVDVEMPIAQFFSFLKRFDLVLTNKSLDLNGAQVDGPHYD